MMAEDEKESQIMTSRGDALVNGIAYNLDPEVFVKRPPINHKLAPMNYTGDLRRKSIVSGDVWEDDATAQHNMKKPKLEKVLIWKTVSQFLSATSLHGLPFMVSAKRFYCGLTFWIVPLVLALGLMLWALISVTKQYSNMTTILSTKLHFHNHLPFPAVTICNKNLFRKSVAESTGINLNELIKFLHIAAGNPFLFKTFNFQGFFNKTKDLIGAENSPFFSHNAGHQIKQMLYSCQFAGENCSTYNFTQRSSSHGNCYTFNSGIDMPTLNSVKRGFRYGLEVVLNAEQYEYFLLETDAVGFNIFIHDPDHFPYYESTDSFSVTTGELTEVALKKTDYKLLSLSCGEVDLKYFKTYSRLSCITECLTDFIVDACGCKNEYLPGTAKNCSLTNECLYNNTPSFSEEQCNCPIPCDFTTYEKMLSHSRFPASHIVNLFVNSEFLSQTGYRFPDFVISAKNNTGGQYLNENFNRTFLMDNLVKLQIYYDTLVTTTMEEGLEYTTAQFIADFSGYVGLFTGAGFLTIFEIIQMCFGLTSPELMPIY